MSLIVGSILFSKMEPKFHEWPKESVGFVGRSSLDALLNLTRELATFEGEMVM